MRKFVELAAVQKQKIERDVLTSITATAVRYKTQLQMLYLGVNNEIH